MPASAVSVSHAIRVRPEALVRHQLRQREHLAQQHEEAVVSARDHQLAVARGEDLVRRDHREDGALRSGDGAVCEIADEVVADIGERRLVQRGVDDRACAGSLALQQRGGDPEPGPHPRAHVDER